jgi:peptidoglycan-associated lipoprotein
MNTNIQVATSAGAKIKIEGNCDEFGTDEYNYALGLKRAKAVKDSLVAQGITSSKMIMVSFGESSPVCQTPSDSCYDRNRRVDIRLAR